MIPPDVQQASGRREPGTLHRLVWYTGCSAAPLRNFENRQSEAQLYLWVDNLHQCKHRVLEECSSSERSLCGLCDVLRTLRPHSPQNLDNIVIIVVTIMIIIEVMIATGFWSWRGASWSPGRECPCSSRWTRWCCRSRRLRSASPAHQGHQWFLWRQWWWWWWGGGRKSWPGSPPYATVACLLGPSWNVMNIRLSMINISMKTSNRFLWK